MVPAPGQCGGGRGRRPGGHPAGPDGTPTSSSTQPSLMATMLTQLEIRPGMRVLEVGTGTGYNAALLAELVGPGGLVTSVDIQPDVVADARAALDRVGFDRVVTRVGDGSLGAGRGAVGGGLAGDRLPDRPVTGLRVIPGRAPAGARLLTGGLPGFPPQDGKRGSRAVGTPSFAVLRRRTHGSQTATRRLAGVRHQDRGVGVEGLAAEEGGQAHARRRSSAAPRAPASPVR